MGTLLETKFEKMGARVKVMSLPAHLAQGAVRIDVRRDKGGEYFDVRHRSDVHVDVLDVKADDRHLLLMTRSREGREAKSKFLCGHDERAWFVAAVPETARARNVQDAKDALKPPAVWDAMRERGVRRKDRDRRRTAAFVRQGEWFFIPRPKFKADESLVLKDEPIRRGGGKPHRCQFLFRTGGETVRVHRRYPNGLSIAEYSALPKHVREMKGWRTMARNARVYVKGSVRHSDHATVWLDVWHEVVMNTETQAAAMRQVAFLD